MKIRIHSWALSIFATILLFVVRNKIYNSVRQNLYSGDRNLPDDSSIGFLESCRLVEPQFYIQGDKVNVIVNKIWSHNSDFIYDYYDLNFVCAPSSSKGPLPISLKDVLIGDQKWESDYNLAFGKDEHCVKLCDQEINYANKRQAYDLIKEDYVVEWSIDNGLPASTTFINENDSKKYYINGFSLGFEDPETGKIFINNHLMFIIRFHKVNAEKSTIVGFEVYPKSISDSRCPGASRRYEKYELSLGDENAISIPFTYAVYWREEFEISWSERWKSFMRDGRDYDRGISHWKTFLYQVIAVGSLLLVILAILRREDHNLDFTARVVNKFVQQENSFSFALNVCMATSIHFLFAIIAVLFIIHPVGEYPGFNCLLFSLSIFVVGSYTSSLCGRLLDGNVHHKKIWHSLVFGCSLPSITLCVVIFLRVVFRTIDSASHIMLGMMTWISCASLGLSIPSSILGGYTATKIWSSNVRPNSLRKKIHYCLEIEASSSIALGSLASPAQPRNSVIFKLLYGAVSSSVIYLEMAPASNVFSFNGVPPYRFLAIILSTVFFVCVSVCLLSMIACYLEIKLKDDETNQNYRRSHKFFHSTLNFLGWTPFQIGGSIAWYLEAYAIYYLICISNYRDLSSIFLFVCYTGYYNLMCYCLFGSLSYGSYLWFVSKLRKPRSFHFCPARKNGVPVS